nr:hypothetical protein [Vicinamibacterales bacterium]
MLRLIDADEPAAGPRPAPALEALPIAAALCDERGFVTAGNGRLRSSLPLWMHARLAGLVPLFLPARLDATQRASLARDGAVVLDLRHPREPSPDVPAVRLRIGRAPEGRGFLVLAHVLREEHDPTPVTRAGPRSLIDDADLQRTLEAAD